jgi:hypothetical protein
LLCPNLDRWYGGHAHDSQGLALRHQRPSLVCSEPVLLTGFLIVVGLAAGLCLIALLRQNRRPGRRHSRLSAKCQARPRHSAGILRMPHRKKRRLHGSDHERAGRQRHADRDAPVEVPEQPRRARSSSHQTHHLADARLQDLSLRPHPARRHRGHALDPQRPARIDQRPGFVRSGSVLLVGFLIGVAAILGFPTLLRQNLTASPPARRSRLTTPRLWS